MPLPAVFENLLGAVAKSAGATVAQDPQVQAALAVAQSELQFYKTLAIVGGVVLGAEFLFYYVPRFRSPLEVLKGGQR